MVIFPTGRGHSQFHDLFCPQKMGQEFCGPGIIPRAGRKNIGSQELGVFLWLCTGSALSTKALEAKHWLMFWSQETADKSMTVKSTSLINQQFRDVQSIDKM